MNTSDIEKLIPRLDPTSLTKGEYDFMADNIAIMRETLKSQLYGVLVGYDEFWRERDDCPLESKFKAMGPSLRMFFTAHILLGEGLNRLAGAANAVLPVEDAIELLDLKAPGEIEFKKDGSLKKWTPAPEPEIEEPEPPIAE